MEARDEEAGERRSRGGSSVWEVLWPAQVEGSQRAGCNHLLLRRPGPLADPGGGSLWIVPGAT